MFEKPNPHRIELDNKQMEEAYKKACEILRVNFPRIKEADFADIYGAETVRNQKLEVEKIKKGFETAGFEKESKRGVIFEALILDLFQNFWFNSFELKRSSETDDYKNQVDAVLTKRKPTSISAMALSIDPTTSLISLKKKAKKIDEKSGLTNISYCVIGNFRGHLEGVPHVVVYMNDEIFTQILRLWLKADTFPVNKEKLNNHVCQIIFLEQILHQLNLTIGKLKSRNILSISDKNSLTIAQEYQRSVQLQLSEKKQQLDRYYNSRREKLRDELSSLSSLQSIQAIKSLFV